MSPEQARGKAVDKRADILAFGAVLFEMLTGTRAFEGEDLGQTLARVVEREPDFGALPPSVPARVSHVLRVCLRKDPKQRASMSPTLSLQATRAGMILGTAAYMAPEQARGKVVDKRADIWAFGAVLFEMLTGTRAFAGEDIADVLSRVLQREPDWAALPSGLSPTLVVYLKRCLHKDLGQRIGDIHDVRLALEGAFETPAPQTPVSAPASASRGRRPLMAALAVAVVGMVALALPRADSRWCV